MDQMLLKNLSSPVFPSYSLNLFNNNKKCVTTAIIKRNVRKKYGNFLTKKTINQMLPKYLTKSKHPIQKQNLLHQIQKQNKKLRNQQNVNTKLQRMLYKKQNKCLNKTSSLKTKTDGFRGDTQGKERKTATSTQKQLPKRRKQNFIKSVYSQLEKLQQKRQKNFQVITKIKHSKKYTRFLENREQWKVFQSELISMQQYMKRIATQANRLKRIKKEQKARRMQQLLMQGDLQESVQVQNIKIYCQVQQRNEQLKSLTTKHLNLNKKKKSLLTQIQIIKKRHNLPQEVIQIYYQSIYGSNNRSRVVMSGTGEMGIVKTGHDDLNGLQVLKEDQYEDDVQSSSNSQGKRHQLKKPPPERAAGANKKTPRETIIQTVKINSDIQLGNGQFMGYQYRDESLQVQNQRREIQELQRKYFCEEDSFDDYEQDNCRSQKLYSDGSFDGLYVQSHKDDFKCRKMQLQMSKVKQRVVGLNVPQKIQSGRNSKTNSF